MKHKMPFFQFIGAFLGAGFVVITASLAWPRISSTPRPDALQKVRDVVITTDAGRNYADVLGVTDETLVTPVSVSGFIAGVAGNVVSTVTTNVQNSVRSRVLESIAKQFNELPSDQKEIFRAEICAPVDAGVPPATPQGSSSGEPQE